MTIEYEEDDIPVLDVKALIKEYPVIETPSLLGTCLRYLFPFLSKPSATPK